LCSLAEVLVPVYIEALGVETLETRSVDVDPLDGLFGYSLVILAHCHRSGQ
jgi:hypothetical protein